MNMNNEIEPTGRKKGITMSGPRGSRIEMDEDIAIAALDKLILTGCQLLKDGCIEAFRVQSEYNLEKLKGDLELQHGITEDRRGFLRKADEYNDAYVVNMQNAKTEAERKALKESYDYIKPVIDSYIAAYYTTMDKQLEASNQRKKAGAFDIIRDRLYK